MVKTAGHPRPVVHSRWAVVIRVAMPLVAAGAGFCPWLYAIAPGHASVVLKIYTLYGLSALSWVWLAAVVILAASAAAGRRSPAPGARDRASLAVAAVSLGTALAAIVCVHVASLVSTVLSAPTPVALGYGVWVFGAAAFVWTLASAIT